MSSFSQDMLKCSKPDCRRLVPRGIYYCCHPCAVAAAGRYEVNQHSSGCDLRLAERGECPEARYL
jgi:hypothetical protein